MKLRTPASIFIPLTLLAILLTFVMILPSEQSSERGLWGMFVNLGNGIITAFKSMYFWGVALISLVMLFMVNTLNKMVESKKFEALSEEDKLSYLAKKKRGYLKNLFLSSRERQSEEEEKSIILDHGFDGITELDNALPQWWLSLFYFGCAFMVVYILAYSFTDFADQITEYEEETEYLDNKFTIWLKNNDIDITGAENKADNDAVLAQGKEVFLNNCATCHTANGGGAAGPNLTDDYWINQLQDSLFYNVYNVVYNGAPNNAAMQAFGEKKVLTGLQIEAVSSYVYDMNQNQPDVTTDMGGKEKQGTLPAWYKGSLKGGDAPAESSDSTATGIPESTEEIALR